MSAEKIITVVCGFSRCGTSLTMKMLDAGGMGTGSVNKDSYEDERASDFYGSFAWLEELQGQAVKVLEPQRVTFPKHLSYRFILLSRNPAEQGKSQLKFLRVFMPGLRAGPEEVHRLAQGMMRDRPSQLAKLMAVPNSTVLQLRFEDVIDWPLGSAATLSKYCGGLDATAMAKVVRKRSPKCLPYLAELEDQKREAVNEFMDPAGDNNGDRLKPELQTPAERAH